MQEVHLQFPDDAAMRNRRMRWRADSDMEKIGVRVFYAKIGVASFLLRC